MKDAITKEQLNKPDSTFKVPESKSQKIIDLKNQGKRRNQSDSQSVKSTAEDKEKKHKRISSVASRSHASQSLTSSPSSSKKPASVASNPTKSFSKARPANSDDDMDETESVAESTVSVGKIRRTEEERLQYFQNQPECGKIDAHAAFCIRCNKVVKLGTKRKYTVRPWEIHRARCDRNPPVDNPPAKTTELDQENETPSTLPSHARMTPAERKNFLEADERAEQVETDRAKCRKCQKWVTLSKRSPYETYYWTKHQLNCAGVEPSNRVAAAERKLRLVNDPQAKNFGPRHVDCLECGAVIGLEGPGDYNLQLWDEHKTSCYKNTPKEIGVTKPNSVPFPSASENDPASVSDHKPRQGLKREREDHENQADDKDARPSTRARTFGYQPPEVQETPLGWFLLPFKTFMRGFRESLSRES